MSLAPFSVTDDSSSVLGNGRINMQLRKPGVPNDDTSLSHLPGFDYRTETSDSQAEDAIRGNHEKTPLNQAFFSTANFQIVQNKIRREVFDRSGYKIAPQSADQLFMVMRAMYNQYCKHQPTNIPGQIAELNALVAEWAVPKIISEVSMYATYLRDIQTLPVPMAPPIQLNMKGSRSIEFKTFF